MSTFRFLDLPLELRRLIYDFYVPGKAVKISFSDGGPYKPDPQSPHNLKAISRVNHQIRTEALHYYFSTKRIIVDIWHLRRLLSYIEKVDKALSSALVNVQLDGLLVDNHQSSAYSTVYVRDVAALKNAGAIKHICFGLSLTTALWTGHSSFSATTLPFRDLESFELVPLDWSRQWDNGSKQKLRAVEQMLRRNVLGKEALRKLGIKRS